MSRSLRSLANYIHDSQLNRPESISLASLARQSREISIEHPSVGLASLAQKWERVRNARLILPDATLASGKGSDSARQFSNHFGWGPRGGGGGGGGGVQAASRLVCPRQNYLSLSIYTGTSSFCHAFILSHLFLDTLGKDRLYDKTRLLCQILVFLPELSRVLGHFHLPVSSFVLEGWIPQMELCRYIVIFSGLGQV